MAQQQLVQTRHGQRRVVDGRRSQGRGQNRRMRERWHVRVRQVQQILQHAARPRGARSSFTQRQAAVRLRNLQQDVRPRRVAVAA